MPRPHPPEFRRRAVELLRLGEKPVSEIAKSLGISDSGLRGWVKQADIDDGQRDGRSSAAQAEVVELRRKLRVAELENEILKRAAAFRDPTPCDPANRPITTLPIHRAGPRARRASGSLTA